MSDLSTKYLGIELENPIIAGASGLTANLKSIEKIQESGVGAIVCKSLFEEEIEVNHLKTMAAIKESLSIPVSIKLSPFYTNLTGFIEKADQTGIDGVILFNRLFAPDINIETEEHAFPFSFSRSEDNLITQKYTSLEDFRGKLSRQRRNSLEASKGRCLGSGVF